MNTYLYGSSNKERFCCPIDAPMEVYILANPFADGRINYPAILQDFADCISGWE